MFDKFKAFGAVASLLKDRERLKESGRRIKENAARARATGESGGGAVRVIASGQIRVVSIDLAPALVAGMAADDQTRALVGSLIADAVNDALAKAQDLTQQELAKEADALGLGDIAGGLGGLLA